tara:strand:+ start:1231 stop:1488 length:258 start_codon:yes stop_codon:yes gene_type:complete
VKKNNYKKPGALAPGFKNKLIKILQAAGSRPQAASRAGGPAGGKLQAAGYRRQAAGSKQSRISDQEAASGRVGPQAASSWTEEPE